MVWYSMEVGSIIFQGGSINLEPYVCLIDCLITNLELGIGSDSESTGNRRDVALDFPFISSYMERKRGKPQTSAIYR